ncbi:MAG: GldG family protein, partial [Kiritimatiellae bacterium]|nr:GldG family protein [Kiritimatiellia bacterium]
MNFLKVTIILLTTLWAGGNVLTAEELTQPPRKPSVLVIYGRGSNGQFGDYNYYKLLNQRGFQIDYHWLDENPLRPITWDLIKQYNCLVIINPPGDEKQKEIEGYPPYKKEMQVLLDAFLADGGGVFWMMDRMGMRGMKKMDSYLEHWGAKLPYEVIKDPATMRTHSRNQRPFIYTDKVAASPVSDGVKGIWFPVFYETRGGQHGLPLLVSKDWIEVVRGSDTSFTIDPQLQFKLSQQEEKYYKATTRRPDLKTPPTLYAIREAGKGRMALAALLPIYTLFGGTTWIHNGVVLDKGMAGKRSDFGKLFENTLHWLAEPSLKNGKLGGYVQDPLKLVHPHYRKKPEEFCPVADFQHPTPPCNVYRGLIGARTVYSSGKGTVAEYAAAASAAGLDFVVFLDEYRKLTEEKYRQLEAECKKLSTDKLLLLPGFTFKNNIKNHMFAFGQNIVWPTNSASQWVGKDRDELKQAYYDEKGQLAIATFDVWAWAATFWYVPQDPRRFRNLGYYHFDEPTACPVRDLRLFGILGVMTYINGKLVEDVTPEYLNYVMDGNPPLACAVDLVQSPQELTQAVQAQHYLTHVAANTLKEVPRAMWYGHSYGRANVYPSRGPQIKSWAGTYRVNSYAGEPFVPARYRIRPMAWVTSDV